MSNETIGQVVTSSSSTSDCEAVYSGRIQGLRRLWKEKFNRAHLHFADRAHKIESMTGKIRKEAEMRWLDEILSQLDYSSMKRLVETRYIRYFVGSVDVVLTNAYVLEQFWQEQAAEGDNEICGHLKNLVSPLFLSTFKYFYLPTYLVSPHSRVKLHSLIGLYPLWDDKANVDKFIGNITKMNEMPVLENPLNRRLRLQYPSIEEGNFTSNFSKPDQQVNFLQHDIQFQPRVRNRPQPLTPDNINRITEHTVD
ncbi:Hypothetical predicted protein [Paramuricea clavata]|uniref:Uncharacterized protein n=1 Tax=Paramuricea clavata TaxID=317549 RepID=A0A7D9IGE6_PARCT|nr:Hypothetical predicted protein [Paramuricea clavata]